MDVLFASDVLSPPRGGAERTMLEWIDGLRARGHATRAVSLPPGPRPPDGAYWRWRAGHRAQTRERVAAAIADRAPDVVVAQLHGAAGAQRAAAEAGVPAVLVLASYESLCKLAFDPGSGCPPDGDCVRCPAARRLAAPERAALRASRREHEEARAGAAALVAVSHATARTVERWSGRTATVVHPVGPALPAPVEARWTGHVACVAAQWSPDKGAHLLPALAAAAAAHGRPVRVTEPGLTAAQRAELRAAGAGVVPAAPIDDLLRGASLLLVPSRWDEPFGRVAWEALARGVPVLASAAGGLVEAVPPPLRVAPRGDPAAWTAAVDRLLGDEGAWRRTAAGARDHARTLLDPPPLDVLERRLRAVAGA